MYAQCAIVRHFNLLVFRFLPPSTSKSQLHTIECTFKKAHLPALSLDFGLSESPTGQVTGIWPFLGLDSIWTSPRNGKEREEVYPTLDRSDVMRKRHQRPKVACPKEHGRFGPDRVPHPTPCTHRFFAVSNLTPTQQFWKIPERLIKSWTEYYCWSSAAHVWLVADTVLFPLQGKHLINGAKSVTELSPREEKKCTRKVHVGCSEARSTV